MGNCCGAESQVGKEVNMQRDYPGYDKNADFNHLFDNREIMGLSGRDKIHLIVKLQAFARGVLARRKVKQRYGFECQLMNQGYGRPSA